MDKSEQYIRMCEEAEEIQKQWKPIDGDFCWHGNEGADYLGSYEFPATNTVVHIAIGNTRDYWYNWLWLPRQDQLQEMVANGDCAYDLFHRFEVWLNFYDAEISQLELSMEQLWLAFVMKEKYNKVWAGDSWKATTI